MLSKLFPPPVYCTHVVIRILQMFSTAAAPVLRQPRRRRSAALIRPRQRLMWDGQRGGTPTAWLAGPSTHAFGIIPNIHGLSRARRGCNRQSCVVSAVLSAGGVRLGADRSRERLSRVLPSVPISPCYPMLSPSPVLPARAVPSLVPPVIGRRLAGGSRVGPRRRHGSHRRLCGLRSAGCVTGVAAARTALSALHGPVLARGRVADRPARRRAAPGCLRSLQIAAGPAPAALRLGAANLTAGKQPRLPVTGAGRSAAFCPTRAERCGISPDQLPPPPARWLARQQRWQVVAASRARRPPPP